MVNKIIIIMLLLIPINIVNSMERGYHNRQLIEKYNRSRTQALQYFEQSRKKQCAMMINKYIQRLRIYPRNEYYRYQLEYWRKKCRR